MRGYTKCASRVRPCAQAGNRGHRTPLVNSTLPSLVRVSERWPASEVVSERHWQVASGTSSKLGTPFHVSDRGRRSLTGGSPATYQGKGKMAAVIRHSPWVLDRTRAGGGCAYSDWERELGVLGRSLGYIHSRGRRRDHARRWDIPESGDACFRPPEFTKF